MNFLFINVNQTQVFASSDTIPLSMGYILAYMKSRGYGGVILDDLLDRPLSLHALEMWISKLQPKAIGFTAYQQNMERIRFFSHYIKSNHRNVSILLGGPQAFFMPSPALRELEDVDVICRGEGEIIAVQIAECLEKNEELSSVSGITFREGHKIIDTKPSLDHFEDLDQFPSPYLNGLINLEGKEMAILTTSRGCRYNCLFCISPAVSSREIRYHSVSRVLDEMEYLETRGIKRFWLADENFTGSPKVSEILQGKIDRGIRTSFWCQTRCDLVNIEMLKKLRQAGADTVAFGLESANSDVLRITGKGINTEYMRSMIEAAKSVGLNVELYSLFGLPNETVDKARETLDFVKTCRVPIRENSRAQQMQLYFGSPYQENHEKYGFRVIPAYNPAYLSIGDRYETQTLTSRDIRRIRCAWLLALEDFGRNATDMERPFDLLNFLLENEEELRDDEAFYEYGAIISSALEEHRLLWRFLDGYVNQFNPSESRLIQLISKLKIFRESHEPIGSTSRVIFDSRSEIHGASSVQMKGGYDDVVLGCNQLPPWFEKHLVGLRQGQRTTFEITFPKDFIPAELQEKTASFWVNVHKTLNLVDVTSLKHLKSMNIRNHYVFSDLDRIRQDNEILYYLALRDIPGHDLVKTPTHFLMHMYYSAKLHKMEIVKRAAAMLSNDAEALKALAETLYSAEKYVEAAYYYGKSSSRDPETLTKRARSLFLGGEAQKALNLLDSMHEKTDLPYQDLLLECLKKVQPHSERIRPLDRNVLRLKVDAARQKEMMNQAAAIALQPIVHGD